MDNELWKRLYGYSKKELREHLALRGITRTKSLSKYYLVVKLYKAISQEKL